MVANDADLKRINTLRQRLRLSGCDNIIVTCSLAEDLHRFIPFGFFDRIVCDVPCTGDGTFRKYPHLWRQFRPRSGVAIHPLQVQIASAAVQLLADGDGDGRGGEGEGEGGRMVYSTCSLNPIEDEAVVAELLRRHDDLEVVDVRAEGLLSGLVSREGLCSWACDVDSFLGIDKDANDVDADDFDEKTKKKQKQHSSMRHHHDEHEHKPERRHKPKRKHSADETARERQETARRLGEITPSMRPPDSATEQTIAMQLRRCLRILPHDQDTGGFFVAVLRKRKKPQPHQPQPHQQHQQHHETSAKSEVRTLMSLGFNPKRLQPSSASSASSASASAASSSSCPSASASASLTKQQSDAVSMSSCAGDSVMQLCTADQV